MLLLEVGYEGCQHCECFYMSSYYAYACTGTGLYLGEGFYYYAFFLFSTRVMEFLQLQLDCIFEIQIYDRTQKIRKLF
jgi:hypothetical protein